jgi:diguanylate cyclase (GGDEF)-like protein
MLYRKLAEEAIRDPLTGAFNRRYFIMKAEEALSHAARYGHTVALLVVDLQRFSDVNDEFGHKTGDRVLALVANAFTQSLRASDTFFRIGGDEFVMLLPQADTDAAKRAAERCAAALPAEPELARYSVRANVGWAVYPADGATVDDLLETGDRRMYVAKTAGEDVYDPAQE